MAIIGFVKGTLSPNLESMTHHSAGAPGIPLPGLGTNTAFLSSVRLIHWSIRALSRSESESDLSKQIFRFYLISHSIMQVVSLDTFLTDCLRWDIKGMSKHYFLNNIEMNKLLNYMIGIIEIEYHLKRTVCIVLYQFINTHLVHVISVLSTCQIPCQIELRNILLPCL